MPSASSRAAAARRVVPGQPPHGRQVAQGVGLAQPVAEVAEDAQRLFQGVGRAAG